MRCVLQRVVLAAVLAAPGAQAAEILKAPTTARVQVQDWEGFYVGGHIGYGWSTVDYLFPVDTYYNLIADIGKPFSVAPDGVLGGFHVGYNWQYGNWVIGIEGSYDFSNIKNRRVGVFAIFPEDVYSTRLRSVYSVTGRVGWAVNQWLFYGKGGWAGSKFDLYIVSGNPGPGIVVDLNGNLQGWTAGAGIEYMIQPNIILGLEYDHFDFNGKTLTGFESPPQTGGTAIHADTTVDAIFLRASYLFGHFGAGSAMRGQ
jgi:outer membrane immunogenic protein